MAKDSKDCPADIKCRQGQQATRVCGRIKGAQRYKYMLMLITRNYDTKLSVKQVIKSKRFSFQRTLLDYRKQETNKQTNNSTAN